MEELIRVLEKTVSNLQSDQNEAIRYIEGYIARDFPGFLKALSEVLFNQQNPPIVRTAAGLQLKNQLTSRDETVKIRQQERWRSLPEQTRHHIKERVFRTLGTELFRPSSAPQCVAYIAIIELPDHQWPGLIQALTNNVTDLNNTIPLRLASLEAIGYICQDIDQNCIQPADSDSILTAIVGFGMREVEIDEVKLSATTALLDSLEFTETNFQKQNERDHIMQAVCNATQSSNPQIAVAALQCLVKIMSLYYQYMDRYMEAALCAITTNAMRSENDDIALQGIEFWSNVCDEEVQLANEAEEAQEVGDKPERISQNYARKALSSLVPILVEMLTRQDESDDSEEWKPCKAAGVCLMLMSSLCGNEIVGFVLPFITRNVTSEDWRRRDAAIMTFGSILDGPDPSTLQEIAIQVVPLLIRFMRDPSITVRDSSAWVIGKLCDTVPDAVLSVPDCLQTLIQALADNLSGEPRVASNVCWAINSLVTAAGQAVREQLPPKAIPETFILSKFYPQLIQALLVTTDRQDASKDQEQSVRSAAYEALMGLIKQAPNDCYHLVFPSTFELLMRKISCFNDTLQRPDICAPEIRAQIYEFLSLLWTTMAACLRRMDHNDTLKVSDAVMENLLVTLSCSVESPTTQEDVLLASTALLESVDQHFARYMNLFKPYILNCLAYSGAPLLNRAAVGLLSDLATILAYSLLPHCNDFMNALMTKLKEEHFDKHAKAQILSLFGDFAIAFEHKFEPWVSPCLDMLHHASQIRPDDRNDYDLVDYCTKLRESAIEGYVGIVQGMKGKNGQTHLDAALVLPRIPTMIQFLEMLTDDPDLTEELICSGCGLLGDIMEAFGEHAVRMVNTKKIQQLLEKGTKSKMQKTTVTARWAQNLIKKEATRAAPAK